LINNNTLKKISLITGSSSGIGFETTLLLARSGYETYATMRDINKASSLLEFAKKEGLSLTPLVMDVNNDFEVNSTIEKIARESGRIDVLVNNAGYGLLGYFEDLQMEEIKKQFDTNFFGILRITQKIIPIMRNQKSGTIVNISSGAGRIGFPGISAYVSTKFALEGFSESLYYELQPFGIKVIIIEPGVTKTNFFRNTIYGQRARESESPYSTALARISNNIDIMQEHATNPHEVASIILEAIHNKEPHLRYVVGNDIAMILESKRELSDSEFRKMMMENIN
jgi:short-subunit dehydrogenase